MKSEERNQRPCFRLKIYASPLTCRGLQKGLKSAEPNQTHGFRLKYNWFPDDH
jgi:hypothetical protein